MSPNTITMSYTKEQYIPFLTDAVEFRPTGRLQFFQKWLWKALRKMGALKPYWDQTVEVKRVHIDRKDFCKRLVDSYFKCFPSHDRPKQVYMGPREFQELAMLKEYEHGGIFTFGVRMGYSGKLFDLPITVVPHMNGVLII